MNVTKARIPDILIIEPEVHEDYRGYFMETYNKQRYLEIGIDIEFVQDNVSYSARKGTIRGLHWQNAPMSQAKLVSCVKGRVIDVAVDIRKGSPTYKQWVSAELSVENKKQVFIPKGFAHGFLTLTDDVEVCYKVDNLYSKEYDRAIRYDDTSINVDWGSLLNGMEPVLSEKDKNGISLDKSDANFIYKGEEAK